MHEIEWGIERNPGPEEQVPPMTESLRSQTKLFADPFQLLADFGNTTEAGCLQIFAREVVWNIHIDNGYIKQASTSVQLLSDLNYYLRCSGLDAASNVMRADAQFRLEFTTNNTDTGNDAISQALSWLERREYLNFQQATQIATSFSREALESFFWLRDGEYCWLPSTNLDITCEPALATEALLPEFQKRLHAWQKFRAKVNSPYQRPYLFMNPGSTSDPSPMLGKIAKLLRGLSFYQLSFALKQDPLRVAKLLYPHTKSGELVVREPKAPYDRLPTIPPIPIESSAPPTTIGHAIGKKKTFKIACIDDSPTILDEMQNFLGADEYEVTKIDDPVKAPSILFRLRPDLILMDITMPEINGYKLCSLLRSSTVLFNTPIVMVTGRTGLIDKARAKVTGATDYLTKPFTRGSLLAVVEQHLKK